VIDAMSEWWANHPLQPAASMAEGVVRDAAAPLARRHPLMVVGGAFALGAAITWLRPWRLLGKTAMFAGVFSQVVSRTVMHMPWESIVGALSTFAHAGNDAQSGDATVAGDGQASNEADVSAGYAPDYAAAPVSIKEAA